MSLSDNPFRPATVIKAYLAQPGMPASFDPMAVEDFLWACWIPRHGIDWAPLYAALDRNAGARRIHRQAGAPHQAHQRCTDSGHAPLHDSRETATSTRSAFGASTQGALEAGMMRHPLPAWRGATGRRRPQHGRAGARFPAETRASGGARRVGTVAVVALRGAGSRQPWRRCRFRYRWWRWWWRQQRWRVACAGRCRPDGLPRRAAGWHGPVSVPPCQSGQRART